MRGLFCFIMILFVLLDEFNIKCKASPIEIQGGSTHQRKMRLCGSHLTNAIISICRSISNRSKRNAEIQFQEITNYRSTKGRISKRLNKRSVGLSEECCLRSRCSRETLLGYCT